MNAIKLKDKKTNDVKDIGAERNSTSYKIQFNMELFRKSLNISVIKYKSARLMQTKHVRICDFQKKLISLFSLGFEILL